jgi:hypothetical protein
MIFTQIISAMALAAASVSAVELKHKRRGPKCCKSINCLETLARINFQPKWCGAELLEKVARRAILRPDVNWNYAPAFDAISPCEYMQGQDPSLQIAIVSSSGNITCSTFEDWYFEAGTSTDDSYDYSYPVHAAWSTNSVKSVNFNSTTFVAVPLYFRDGTVETVVFGKDNADLPVVCCDNPDPSLTQCRRFD